MLSCCFMNHTFCFFCFFVFCFLFFVRRCHLQRHKAHEHGKQKLLSLRIWLCVLSGAAPSYLSSAKVPIDWAADCASVSLPVQPSLRPSPPSLHPSPPPPPPRCPRPHWLAVPWLLPADQSAWCLLCLGEVNKLLGQSNGKRGARRAGARPPRMQHRKVWERGGRDETEGQGGKEKRARVANWLASQQDQRDTTQKGGKGRNGRIRDEGLRLHLPQGPNSQSSAGLSRQGESRNIHLQSTRWWQAPQINTRSGIQSVLRLSASPRLFTAVDIGNNCVHEAA